MFMIISPVFTFWLPMITGLLALARILTSVHYYYELLFWIIEYITIGYIKTKSTCGNVMVYESIWYFGQWKQWWIKIESDGKLSQSVKVTDNDLTLRVTAGESKRQSSVPGLVCFAALRSSDLALDTLCKMDHVSALDLCEIWMKVLSSRALRIT